MRWSLWLLALFGVAVAVALGGTAWLLLSRLTARQQARIRQAWLACAVAAGSFWFIERLI